MFSEVCSVSVGTGFYTPTIVLATGDMGEVGGLFFVAVLRWLSVVGYPLLEVPIPK